MNINGGELLIILLVALVVLGPKELPRIGRTLGNVVREFRHASRGLAEELGLDDWRKDAATRGEDPPGPGGKTEGSRGDRGGTGDQELQVGGRRQ